MLTFLLEDWKEKNRTKKLIVAWNCIKSLEHYPITCSTNEEQDEFKKIPFNELFKDQIKIIDNHIEFNKRNNQQSIG